MLIKSCKTFDEAIEITNKNPHSDIHGTLTKPVGSCKSTASSAETSALLAMKRLFSNGTAIIGSSSPVTIIMISHWLCNYITHQLILLLGIWSGQLFVETYLLLAATITANRKKRC